MIKDMPRPRPPHLHREVTRHGRVVWYVRVDKGPRIRLRAEFGTPEFDAEYETAISGSTVRPRKNAPTTGMLAWLVARYRETSDWSILSVATRRQRENIFRHVLETACDKPFARIDAVAINAGIERRAKTPAPAHHFLETMRGLFKWAKKAGMVKIDPTADVDAPRRKEGPGFPAWSESDVEKYERRWPVGTRERVWLDVLLYTGLRRGDAVRIGRQHVRNGIAQLATEKTGIVATLPILPVLAATLAAGPCGDLSFIVGESGQPLTKESFGNMFRDACRAAGFWARRMAFARSRQPGRRTRARPLLSWRRSSVGVVDEWRRITRARPIARSSRSRRCTNWRTKAENLSPHLRGRCGR